MTDFDFEITIGVGESVRRVPVASLAAVFRVSLADARTALTMLEYGPNAPVDNVVLSTKTEVSSPVPAPSDGACAGDTLDSTEGPRRTEPTGSATENILLQDRSDRSAATGRREGGLGEGNPFLPRDPRSISLALGDPGAIVMLERFVREYPEAVIDEALRQALAIPAERITRSRAALFIAIVRRLAADPSSHRNPSPTSHARTQASET
jgi:hypothetical protein